MLKRAALLVPRHTSPLIARCTWLALVMPARAAPADGRSATGCRRTSVAAQRPRPSGRSRSEPSELGDLNRAIIAENERKVIDLAAERAMREARAAAVGQVENIRAGETDHVERDKSHTAETAPEASQQQYAGAAPIAPDQPA